MRRVLIAAATLLVAACEPASNLDLREADIQTLQASMDGGELTSEEIVGWYLDEIARIDHAGPELRSIIELNPDALAIASSLDEERASSGPRGPLHGIPVVLKANIDTGDKMRTTAGSLALENHVAADDAVLVAALRDAGAVILGKANLSEWANFRSDWSSSGWSSIGGQTRNPYDPRRNPCGSSSGSAVAVSANLSVLAIGTETNGSIVCPSAINGVVGIKPTLGLVSRDGIIPIAHSQDTAGPMARTVADAAIALNALARYDAGDPAMTERPTELPDYTEALRKDGLEGKRIAVLRNYWGAGSSPVIEEIFAQTIETLRAAGAEIVDPLELQTDGMYEAQGEVLYYEFKADLNAYLADVKNGATSLEEVIAYNEANADRVMPLFGQEHLLIAQAKGSLDDPEYLDALAKSKQISQSTLNDALREHDLDAIVAPTRGPAWLTDHINGDGGFLGSSGYAAISGYPAITVPAGFVQGLPIGMSFFAGAFSESTLIEIAYAFEQASQIRKPPDL